MVLDNNIINIEIIIAIAGIVCSFVVAKLFYFIFNKYIKTLTKKTKTDIDDRLLAALERPFVIIIVLIGIYFSLLQIDYVRQYIEILNDLFFVLGVLWAVFVLHRLTKVAMEKWISVNPAFQNMPKLVIKIANVFVYFIGLIILLKHFNVEITPLVATLGIGGIAIGFALQDTLSNFFAGLHIISDKPINIGDFIELEGDISGYVEDIGWRSTRIKTLPNTLVIVPNSKIASSIIKNDSLPVPEMSIVIQCGVAYTSDLEKVEKVTIEAAKKIQKNVQGAVRDFEPFIRYHTFGDSNINFSIILRVQTFVDKYLVTHEFIKALKKSYDKEGIEISWPVRKIYYGNADS
ncbi:MAG TPA: mechanosensitive ion channel family protein [Candidatus Nanoarchaeia archaeon]|nr:mechanosensitive ion channel family protein [Candidatus Nanoarchaeia archaeon]